MNKTEFIRSMAETNGISYKQAGEEVDRVLTHIETVLPTIPAEEGKAVLNLTGYVKFTVKDVDAREARNPQTGETVEVDATRQVRISAGAKLKASVKA